MFMHNFCSCGSYKEIESNKSNFVYVLVHRNILMLYLHAIYLCKCASKTILAVTLYYSMKDVSEDGVCCKIVFL